MNSQKNPAAFYSLKRIHLYNGAVRVFFKKFKKVIKGTADSAGLIHLERGFLFCAVCNVPCVEDQGSLQRGYRSPHSCIWFFQSA